VATFISNSPAETEAIGRRFAKDVGLGAISCGGKQVTIMGTPGDDTIVGKKASDVIYGGGGDDKIKALLFDFGGTLAFLDYDLLAREFSREGRKIAGVCLGVAEYFDLDVTIVRLVWLIASVVTGIGLLSYPIAWIVMPEEPHMLPAHAGTGQQVTNS